jgi:DNA alkylation repair enzyme
VTAAADFIDAALQYESSWERAMSDSERLGGGLRYYGASIGAVRGTIRDAARRYPGMTHDEITALSSELWLVPVFERRLAAIVLLQSNVSVLVRTDLTRLEGFLRDARVTELADALTTDVIRPLLQRMDVAERTKADVVVRRWASDDNVSLRAAAEVLRKDS